MKSVTAEYLMGIKEGREILSTYGVQEVTIAERIESLRSTIKGFDASSAVGQMLRGERDFWIQQSKRT